MTNEWVAGARTPNLRIRACEALSWLRVNHSNTNTFRTAETHPGAPRLRRKGPGSFTILRGSSGPAWGTAAVFVRPGRVPVERSQRRGPTPSGLSAEPSKPATWLSHLLRGRYISVMPLVGVSEASRSLAVSPQRVRAMLAAGQLSGRKLEGVWLIDLPLQHDARLRPRRRPMSAAQAWRALALLSGLEIDLDPSARSHLRARLRSALARDHRDPLVLAGLLRAWMRDRAEPRRFHVPDVPHARLRSDARLIPSGVSHPDSPVRDAHLFEAYVDRAHLDHVIRRNSMVPAQDGNVLLRVVSEPEGLRWIQTGLLPWAAIAADLAEHDDSRSITAAGQMIAITSV